TGARAVLGPLSGFPTLASATYVEAIDGATTPIASYAATAVVPDRDGDGTPEIVLANPQGAGETPVVPGVVEQASGAGRVTVPASGYRSALGGDFDGDGIGDVALGMPASGYTWFDTGAVAILWGSP